MNPEALQIFSGQNTEKTSITWSFTSAGEVDAIPYTNVSVVVNGTTYEMGKFIGSCSEIGARLSLGSQAGDTHL